MTRSSYIAHKSGVPVWESLLHLRIQPENIAFSRPRARNQFYARLAYTGTAIQYRRKVFFQLSGIEQQGSKGFAAVVTRLAQIGDRR